MAFFDVKNVKIVGISACVPATISENSDNTLLSKEEIAKYIETTGVERKHWVKHDGSMCTSDLCAQAAERLISELQWDKNDIDLLVFVCQTPDYKMPATACVLQHKLGLSTSCMAFDVSLGCSGFVYGLSLISNLLSTGNAKKGLLLVGNTQSYYASGEDKSYCMIAGDAGSATCLEYNVQDSDVLQFNLMTEGAGKDFLIVPDGGFRNPVSPDSFVMKEYEDGIRRNNLHLHMNGLEVFSFAITYVPRAFKALFDHFGINPVDADYLLLHQANKFICEKIRRKLKFSSDKTPYNIQEYGNTSGTTIPLLMVTNLRHELEDRKLDLLFTGFGVGLSLGTAHITTNKVVVPELLTL